MQRTLLQLWEAARAAKLLVLAVAVFMVASVRADIEATKVCRTPEPMDFIGAANPSLQRLAPSHCKTTTDNPVSFTWSPPLQPSVKAQWTLVVRNYSGATVAEITGQRPRTTLPMRLPVGRYRWQLTYTWSSGGPLQSSWREFEVGTNETAANELPTSSALIQRLRPGIGSRLLRNGMTWLEAGDQVRGSANLPLLQAVLKRAASSVAAPMPTAPPTIHPSKSDEAQVAAGQLGLMQATNREFEHIETLTFAWALTQDKVFLNAVKTRALNLASWDPAGASSEQLQPQANRTIYLALALVTDVLGSNLSADESRAISSVFTHRILAATSAMQRLDAAPYLSFENTSIHYAVQALVLVTGRPGFESITNLLHDVWPVFLAQPQAWGNGDGSNGASVAYAWYDLRHIARTAAVLLLAADIDAMQLSQLNRIGDFLIATTTPSQQHANAYGDGLEVRDLFSAYAHDDFRLYATLTRKPTDEWYWRQSKHARNQEIALQPLHLMIGLLDRTPIVPSPPSLHGRIFEDTGIATFHSDIASSERHSVIFRASRIGSFNHAHADQNSFTFTANGRDLLISSGYYPYYKSPHHSNVTRSTRYKNAVTFDGGIGQSEPDPNPTSPGAPVHSMETRGQLISNHSEENLAIATGDAKMAYRGWNNSTASWSPLLTDAIRSIAFFKKLGLLVVFDWLQSNQPRQWELNYHGVEPFTGSEENLIAANGRTKACIDHYGPAGRIARSDSFDVPAEVGGLTKQYHARFKTNTLSKSATFLTLIRLNCDPHDTRIKIEQVSGAAEVNLDGRRISFQREKAMVTSSMITAVSR